MTRLWHIAWSVSLLAAATVAAVWIACGWCSYVYERQVGGWLDRAVYVEQGNLYLLWNEPGAPSMLIMPPRTGWMPDAGGQWWATPATPTWEPSWSVLGVRYVPATRAGNLNWLVAPLLWPLLVLLILPAVQALRWGREIVRARRGRCPICGYDLRASTDACPECGEPIPGSVSAAPVS